MGVVDEDVVYVVLENGGFAAVQSVSAGDLGEILCMCLLDSWKVTSRKDIKQ